MAQVALVIAPEVFRDEELFDTQAALHDLGHQTTVVSTRLGICTGKLGGTAQATLAVEQVLLGEVDAVAFIGGNGCSVYFDNPHAHRLARECVQVAKPLAAICLAPMILGHAGLLEGKNVTVTPGQAQEIETFGAHYQGPGVVTDGLLITADGPQSSTAFGHAIAAALQA